MFLYDSLNFICDPNVSYVEHLDKVIQEYKRIYQEMSPYFLTEEYMQNY